MEKLIIPYYRSSPKATVISSEDIKINLYDSHLTLRINCSEEVPDEDECMPVKVKNYIGTSTIIKSAIMAIETSYDDESECFDIVIYTATTSWGYNIENSSFASELYKTLTDWLLI